MYSRNSSKGTQEKDSKQQNRPQEQEEPLTPSEIYEQAMWQLVEDMVARKKDQAASSDSTIPEASPKKPDDQPPEEEPLTPSVALEQAISRLAQDMERNKKAQPQSSGSTIPKKRACEKPRGS